MHYIALHCSLFQYITLCCFLRCELTSARPFSDSKKFRETFQFYQLGLINCQPSKSRLQKPKVLTRTDLFFIPIFLQKKKSFILPFDYRIACNTDIFYRAFFNLFPLITPALSESHFRTSQDLLTCEILYKPDTSRL